VDKTDVFKVGDAIHRSFLKGDIEILKQVYQSNMKNVDETIKDEIKKIQSFYTNSTKVLKMDTSSIDYTHYLDLFYKRDTTFYRLRSIYMKDSLNNIFLDWISFDNLTKLCEIDQKEVFCPSWLLSINEFRWLIDDSKKSIRKGRVLIQNANYSAFDFDYLKFRVILRHEISPTSSEIFFNQTIEINKKIFKGDDVWVDIDDMNNYYTGFILNKNNISFHAELIEARPKPESEWCTTIEKLKSLQLNKLTNKKY